MIYHSPIIAFSSKVLLRMRSFVKLTKFIYLGSVLSAVSGYRKLPNSAQDSICRSA